MTITSNMYFSCPTLRAIMAVSACEVKRNKQAGQNGFSESCNSCSQWEPLTTNSANLLTAEQVLTPAQVSIEKPLPKRFDTGYDISRIRSYLGKNK